MDALVAVLKESSDPQFQLDLLKGMSEGLKGQRNVKMPAGWEELEAKLSQSTNPQVRAIAQALALTFGSKGALAALRKQLADAALDAGKRLSALDSLLAARDPQLGGVLQGLLNDVALRGAALRGLAAYDDARTPGLILVAYPKLTAAEKRDALNTLVARTAFARELLTAVAAEKVSRKELSADLVRQLRDLKDEAMNKEVEKLWGVVRSTPQDKQQEIARFKKLIQTGKREQVDARRGRATFAKACQQCHTLFGEGGKVGPDITGSNRADLDYILHNILDPNAEIPNDYRTTTIDTTDDRVITGIVTRQDSASVTVVTANETLTLAKADVQSMRQGELSMMPDGLIAALSEQEVRDLIAYLASPSQVPLRPEDAAP